MDAKQRQSRLVELLRSAGRVDIADAASDLGTAEMTIRRDLDHLVSRGLAKRVRGGAVNLLMRGEELPFAMREMDAADVKRRIGEATAALIRDGESVGLDSGTTVLEVARALGNRRITVMPLSLQATNALAGVSTARLILAGGEVRAGELAMTGPMTIASIAAVRFDTVVLGCCGITVEGQLMAHDIGDAAVKQALVKSGQRKILAVDSSKFGQAALAVTCDLTDFDLIVTDSGAPPGLVESLVAAGVEVRQV